MKAGKIAVLVLVCVLMAGCATGPYSPVVAGSLKGDKLVYLEQADRVPKDVMLEAWKHQPVAKVEAANAQAIPPEVIAEIVKQVLAAIPQVAGGYQKERMNEALLSRRMLFRGYSGEELKDVNDIVRSMGSAIEYMTPQCEPARKAE